MDLFSRFYPNLIGKYKTHCCALAFLSLKDDNTYDEIKTVIDEMKEESNTKMTPLQEITFGSHEKAVIVITLPEEINLAENLAKLGFKEIAEFHRRICYLQDEMLKMWFLSWE